ncbi:MAG: M20/M25/M40 family metallo-hydrolase [Bacteroidota bacterium]
MCKAKTPTLLGFFLIILFSCPTQFLSAQEFNSNQLLHAVKVLASDSLEGRGFGAEGNEKARRFIAAQFKALGVAPALSEGYFQKFEHRVPKAGIFDAKGKRELPKGSRMAVGANVLAKIEGESTKMIVITAHYDHLGIIRGEIYNGADDNASGTAALLAIAEYFKRNTPTHTLLFAAVDAEEIGSPGTKYLFKNFPGEKEDIVLNVNMDMIAHNDKELYVCGTYHYPKLKPYVSSIESSIQILFGHDNPNDRKKDDWSNSSDHRIFHNAGIPFLYFGVEDHEDYHKATDTYENINPDFYLESVKVIIKTIKNFDKG